MRTRRWRWHREVSFDDEIDWDKLERGVGLDETDMIDNPWRCWRVALHCISRSLMGSSS